MANGRLSRKPADVTKRLTGSLDKAERETLRPGVEARVRLHGISPEASRDQRAGCFAGRLAMAGKISAAHYDAAMIFIEDHHNNLIAIRAPRDPSGVDLNRVRGGSSEVENVEFYRRATTRWRAAVAAVQQRQNEIRGQGAIYAALETCVLKDQDAPHMIEWLKEGLTALVGYYGLLDEAA